jgi:hypothetical protein
MQPNSPSPAPPPIVPGGLPHGYEFLQEQQKQKRPLIPGGNSKKTRIIIVAAGAALLLIVGMILLAVLSSAGGGNKQDLLKAAQEQQELIRVSTIGVQKARDPAVLNRAITTQLTLQSDQAQLLAIAKKQGFKFSQKDLNLGKQAKTDALLKSAEQANRFDETFNAELLSELSNYQTTLKKIYDNAPDKAAKDNLAQQFNHVNLLAPPKK